MIFAAIETSGRFLMANFGSSDIKKQMKHLQFYRTSFFSLWLQARTGALIASNDYVVQQKGLQSFETRGGTLWKLHLTKQLLFISGLLEEIVLKSTNSFTERLREILSVSRNEMKNQILCGKHTKRSFFIQHLKGLFY
jgi:hypothetical protein